MSIFVDTGLFYAMQNERAARHDEAVAALSTVLADRYGQVQTSDYVYDEAVTLVLSRTGDVTEACTVGDRIRGTGTFPDAYQLLYVSEPTFERAVDAFEQYRDHSLSFTDATTVALVEHHDVDAVLSFDDDFDGIVERIDPAEV